MKKHLPNIITGLRILCGIRMLCTPVFSDGFYIAYLLGGFTDMIDGTVARKMNAVTPFGEKLDSVADIVFITAAFVKLVPAMEIPAWLWGWTAVILILRIGGMIRKKRFVLSHTAWNRITGLLLFLLPLAFPVLELQYSAGLVCIAATAAAIQEGYSG